MRGSTAAWINISLLPRDCGCGEFADGAVLGRGLFFLVFVGFPVVLSGEETFFLAFVRNLPMVPCGEETFFLAFLAFGSFGTGEGLLWYGICARCKKQAPVVRGAFSGAPGTQQPPVVRNMRAVQKGLLWYATRFLRHSVKKKGLLWYGRDIRCAEQASLVREWYSTAARVVQTERNTKNKSHLFLSTRWIATKVSSKLPQKLVLNCHKS